MAKQETKIVRLAHPFDTEGGVVEKVTLRRPKLKDIRKLDAGDHASELDEGVAMICLLSGLSEAQIDEMDADDFTSISEIVGDFFPQARAAGGVSSPT